MTVSQSWHYDMKVYDRGLTAAETGHTQDIQKLTNGSGKCASRGADSSGDGVEFWGTPGRLSRPLSSYESSGASRVQSLAARYQSGNYRPDAGATSRSMVHEAIAAGAEATGNR